MYPETYRYTKEHEWASVENGVATIGITHHAQHELGDIVYVDLPQAGKKLEAHAILGSVESVKAVSDIYCPLGGEVTEVNAGLATEPERLNQDPHGAAWLIKLRLDAPDDFKNLMSAQEYQDYVGAES